MAFPTNVIVNLPTHVTGIPLLLVPAADLWDFEIQRAPDSSGAPGTPVTIATVPGTTREYIDYLPVDGATWWYRGRHVFQGFVSSAYTPYISAKAIILSSAEHLLKEGRRQLTTIYNSDGALLSSVTAVDAGVQRLISKGRLSGQARNGDAISFAQSFGSTPTVRISGGISYEPRSKWNASGDGTGTTAPTANPQYDDFAALSLTASGFTVRARLRQKGGTTTTTDNLPTTTLHSVGNTSQVALSGVASDDNYTSHYSVTVRVAGDPNTNAYATMVIATDTSPDGSTWTERNSKSYTVNKPYAGTSASQTWSGETQLVTVSGLSGGYVRVRIKSIDDTGLGSTQDLNPVSVTYASASGDQYASKTPDSGDYVTWEAVAG